VEDIGTAEAIGSQGVTVRRTFALLRTLGRMSGPVGVTQLALEAGLAKTTAHRLLHHLAAEGIVVHQGRKWVLGTGLRDLDRRLPDLASIAHARLRGLTLNTGATVFAYAHIGGALTALVRFHGPRLTQAISPAEQVRCAESPASVIFRALERGQLSTKFVESHPACNCIATPFELPSGEMGLLSLASTSRGEVESLKSALDRSATALSADMRRVAS
jgi:hypothetical protein